MSFVFRDPFFDAFDDYLTNSMPCYCAIDNDDEKNSAVQKNPKVRRDVITPLSGFGRMDVHENENEYEVDVDIPGMSKEDIKVSSEENKLVIEGERKSEKKEDDDKTNFHREVCLPGNALMDKIEAKYEDGVLKVCVPKEKKVESSKKQITVN
ncbi:Heat shock protein [Blastocystis sp. ATCC 50177/Nand II]|uniref:Heat shock protein n=1 Tax=Blastocystis sp. subtype 1 (strain ATCC 50177 / NandII) TaxID=478820 RepID=A0A196SHH2_BLAHN|nr:Heat shock protein [Blastocystis sp. ATCC 50177/Nand II]